MENTPMEQRVHQLERKLSCLTIACTILLAALSFTMVEQHTTRVRAAEKDAVLHLKGLIIEDESGRARILLGAPDPSVKERLNQDSPTTAMTFLDEQGHDRLLVGEMFSSTPKFHRIGSAYGMNIYSPDGQERGGMGFLSNGSTVNRAVIALDRPNTPSAAGDAWGAMVDDKTGFAGTAYMYAPDIGHGNEAILIGTQGQKPFITFKDVNGKPRSNFLLEDNGSALFQLTDSGGKIGPNLLGAEHGETEPAPVQ